MASSRILEFSKIIATNAAVIDTYFQSQGLASPSFDVNSPTFDVPVEDIDVGKVPTAVVKASIELKDLLCGCWALVNPNLNFYPSKNTSVYYNLLLGLP